MFRRESQSFTLRLKVALSTFWPLPCFKRYFIKSTEDIQSRRLVQLIKCKNER